MVVMRLIKQLIKNNLSLKIIEDEIINTIKNHDTKSIKTNKTKTED